MNDFFEIDFINIESKKSGDAIALRYSVSGQEFIHIVDGGFQQSGELIVEKINEYYNKPSKINFVLVTHPDGDHAGGLISILESFQVDSLWMLRPWKYASEIIDRFTRFRSVENLEKRLKEIYPNIYKLESLAIEKGIKIFEPFQGAKIGNFVVMAPSKDRYLDMIVESEKTPEQIDNNISESNSTLYSVLEKATNKVFNLIKSAWGIETFSSEETSAENEMSVIQYANLCNKKILLTGDAGRQALKEALDYSKVINLKLPGIDKIQVPHHGSRRNVSTELLDQWLGPKLQYYSDEEKYTAIISASKEDADHPKKSVIRAFIHRGGKVISNENNHIRVGHNAPNRNGWGPVDPLIYPEEEEKD